jgi:hypothetical protein
MAFITVWRSGAVHCILVLNGEQMSIRLVDECSLIHNVAVKSTEAALHIAALWERDPSSGRWFEEAVA